MRVPLSWLRDYVAVDMPLDELATRLSISTAEIEGVERRGVSDVDGVVAGAAVCAPTVGVAAPAASFPPVGSGIGTAKNRPNARATQSVFDHLAARCPPFSQVDASSG